MGLFICAEYSKGDMTIVAYIWKIELHDIFLKVFAGISISPGCYVSSTILP
jgi:hypothetical protein